MTESDKKLPSWLLLLFFLPAQQAHARVQAWRRLQKLGAVSLNNSAYALPESSEAREDFEWIRNQIAASGGQAMVLVAQAPEQATADEIVGAFRAARARDFAALEVEASKLLKRASTSGKTLQGRRQLTQGVRRLHERFEEIVRRDFFGAPERDQVSSLLMRLDQRTGRIRNMEPSIASANATEYRGKTWLTRPRPGVDRMSSAWLIRRFIDSDATFVFADTPKRTAAIPFDTFEAEFGHHGTHCTFETLCDRFGITDAAVRHIGRIVHDLDLKENTYGEAEAATIGRLVEGLRLAQPDDSALLRAGIDMFEALYRAATESALTSRPSLRAKRQAARSKRPAQRQKRNRP